MWKIYALVDPETFAPVYIGHTSQALSRRLSEHVHDASRHKEAMRPLFKWINALPQRPVITLLEECETSEDARTAEQRWINKANPALNIQLTDRAKEHFAEVNQRKSEKTKGRPKSEEWKEKIRQGHLRNQGNRGKVRSAEEIAQIKATFEKRKAEGLPVGRPIATENNPKTIAWRKWRDQKRLKES